MLELEQFSNDIWEPACGEGHMSKVLEEHGYNVFSSDKVDRGYGEVLDFLTYTPNGGNTKDIVTNPPYKYAKEFVEHALDISSNGTKVAMFLKIQFLEGQARRKLYNTLSSKSNLCSN